MESSGAAPFEVDTSQWPLVRISPVPDSLARPSESLTATYPEFTRLLSRGRPLMTVFDARGLKVDAAGRRDLASWVQDNKLALREHLVAHAAIVGSSFERGLFTAMVWLIRPSWPMRAFSDRPAAEAWLQSEWEARFGRTG